MNQKYSICLLSALLLTGCGSSSAPAASAESREDSLVIDTDEVTAEDENQTGEEDNSSETVSQGLPYYDVFTDDHKVNSDILDMYHHYVYKNENDAILFYLDTRNGFDIHVITYDDLGAKEEVYIVDMQSLKKDGDGYEAEVIYNQDGADVSDYFAHMNIKFSLGFTEVEVKRDYDVHYESVNVSLIDGDYYFLEPFESQAYYDFMRTEALIYYRKKTGICPRNVTLDLYKDHTMSIHLFEIVDDHTATYAWYTVDFEGNGTDDMTGEEVHFFE